MSEPRPPAADGDRDPKARGDRSSDPDGDGARRRLAPLVGLTHPAAQANVPAGWWKLGYATRFWALLVPVSLAAGMAGAGLRLLIKLVEHQSWGYRAGELTNAVGRTGAEHRIVTLAVAGALAGGIWWAMRRWTGSTGGSLNDTLWSGEGQMPFVPTLVSAALSTVIIAMGVSLGREQPPKDAGAAIAGWAARRCSLSRQERCLLMACAAGAAWAAVYNIPLAGGVFAAEVLIGTLALPVIIPALASSAIAVAISWTVVPVHPYYQNIPAYRPATSLIVFAIAAGPVLGAGGMLFVWLLGIVNPRRVRGNLVLVAPLAAFVILGLVAIPYPLLLGNGRDLGQAVFLGGLAPTAVIALLVLKPLVTAMCWGSGARGGMFTPTTAYGGLLGAILGRIWATFWPAAPPGAYALVGAAAVLAAGMSAPLSAAVLMVELTGGTLVSIIAPTMIAIGLASLTGRLLGGGSIYTARLSPDAPERRWLASGSWAATQVAGGPLPGFDAGAPAPHECSDVGDADVDEEAAAGRRRAPGAGT